MVLLRQALVAYNEVINTDVLLGRAMSPRRRRHQAHMRGDDPPALVGA
jgi:hypothetical protein